MNEQEILSAARKQKYRGGEVEKREADRSVWWAVGAGFLVSIGFFLWKFFKTGVFDFGLYAVWLMMLTVQLLVEGIRTRKKWEIAGGAICLPFAVFAVFGFFAVV